MSVVYSIADWQNHFENNRTRQLHFMTWVPIPNRMDGDGYTELLDHPNGAAHFGAWVSLVEVASKCHPRGTLLREGDRPYDIASLSRVTRISAEVFNEAIPRLISIGWLTSQVVAFSTDTTITQTSAFQTQSSASLEERNGTERKDIAAGCAAVPKPGGKARKKSDVPSGPTAHRRFTDAFVAAWSSAMGETYAFQNAKDGAAAGRVLKVVNGDVEKAMRLVSAFLADSDPFIAKSGYTLAFFSSQINRYLAGTHAATATKTRDADGGNGFERSSDPEQLAIALGNGGDE